MNKSISVNELKNLYENNEKFILLDVRTDTEILQSRIPINSIHIPINEIPNRIIELDKNQNIIVYCKSGKRSQRVCDYLIQNSFNNIQNLDGGILAWANKIDPALLIF